MNKIVEKAEWLLDLGGTKKDVTFLVISGISLILSFIKMNFLPMDLAWIAIVLCGLPIIIEAIIGLVTEFDIKADVLVSLALIASVIIGEYFAAGEVAFIMQIGGLLEELTVAKARAGIEKLVHLTPQTARIISYNKNDYMENKTNNENIVPAKDVKIGNILRILPGETIPVDGIILSGQTSVNQAVMTGESMPVDKCEGDEVSSGTVNQFGTFEMEATRVGEDSSIQRMIKLVQSADAGKAKIVGIADRWATWIVVIALSAAAITWIITGEIIRAVTILVVFCPCALVLATPTAIMAAIGNATKHGFLVREGDALERLADVSKIVFDKTGTLTIGIPQVVGVESILKSVSENELFALTAAVECKSEHPLGKAIVNSYKKKNINKIPDCDEFKMIPGQGVMANVEGKKVLAGNEKMLNINNIIIEDKYKKDISKYLEQGQTVIYIAINGDFAGIICMADTLRKESKNMIESLNIIGVEPILLTGDNKNAAASIAQKLGINKVFANCLPETKLDKIDEYQKDNEKVCMIGDGVNDAPALKKANVGIAMGGIGSDIAVDAADITLVDDEIKELPHLLALSRRMMKVIKINLSFSMLLNFIAIILAITGILGPVVGALVHNCGSVLVIINSSLLLKWKKN